jgi:uncharacterized protein YndB with AHSA1/START domain
MLIASDRRFAFAPAPEVLWAALADVPSYPRWWPWLHAFDGRRLAPGQEWACAVKPPLPYVLHFRIRIETMEPGRSVDATVSGDIRGRAALTVAPAGAGSEVRLRSELAPANRWLEAVATVARPAVRYGHDWVLDTGARQFATAADRSPGRQGADEIEPTPT